MRNFSSLFRGREDVYGYYGSIANVKPTDRGKRVGRAATRREPVTPELWQAHLEGRERLGIVPVMKDGKVWWFVIDVDHYQEEGLHADIAARIKQIGLPLVQTRSKSGGAHLWCFLSEPMLAAEAIEVAKTFKKKLALPEGHVEVFPKQVKIDDVGSWVNLPYFGEACHCTGEDGLQELTLDQFLTYANDRVVHPSDLQHKKAERVRVSVNGAPPCVDWMEQNGVAEGKRNDAVAHYAVYARQAFEDWQEKVIAFNDEHCDPPLDKYEMRTIIKSAAAGKFHYLCRSIADMHCDKTTCKKREYGVGRGDPAGEIDIERIEKIDGENPVYRITMSGRRFQCTLDELFHYNQFKKIALGAVNRFLPMLKQCDWEEFMRDRLERMVIEEAVLDTQMASRVMNVFKRWSEGATTSKMEDALAHGIPFWDGHDKVFFKGEDFMRLVDAQLKLDRNKTWSYMRDAGCVIRDLTVEGKKIQLWCYIFEGAPWFETEDKV